MNWEEIVRREDIVGGDIETQEDGDVYRGPIKEIRLEDGYVTIKSDWMAKMEGKNGRWRKWNITSLVFAVKMVQAQDIGEGRIFFRLHALGIGTIFPRGGSKLDPAKVEGL